MVKLILIIALIVGGFLYFKSHPTTNMMFLGATSKNQGIVASALQMTKDIGGNVLGIATNTLMPVASQSAEKASNFALHQTTSVFLKQIEKLPQKDQEEIKKVICK